MRMFKQNHFHPCHVERSETSLAIALVGSVRNSGRCFAAPRMTIFLRRLFGKILFAGIFIAFAPAMRAGNDFAKDFERANLQYDRGNFREAKKGYDFLVANGHYSAALFYNLGNAEFRLGHKGEAILDYERALALEPSQPEARANLTYARDQTGAKIAPRNWRDRLVADLNANSYCWAAVAAGWAGLFILAAIVQGSHASRKALWLALVCCAAVFGYSIFAIQFLEKERSLAIVTAKTADARFAPADNSTLAAVLPAGSRVRILEKRGAWSYSELPDGSRAWIPAAAVGNVRLNSS